MNKNIDRDKRLTIATAAILLMAVFTVMCTTASAAVCDEPCGTKVLQCTNGAVTKDAVYALVIPGVTQGVPGMAVGFWDANGNGAFEDGECIYIDTNAGLPPFPAPGVNRVEPGDIRLCGYCGDDPNAPLMACDNEIGLPLTYPDNVPVGQRLAGYVDADLNGYYDINDPLYLDMDRSQTVTPDDLRLTGYMGYDPYTVVRTGDADCNVASPILLYDLVVQGVPFAIVTPINNLLGFVDSSCDNLWDNREMLAAGQATGEDKLYLQQPVLVNPNSLNVLDPFEDFVTIGDFRLYMPPDEPCWPECGTKVQQCDPETTYPLLIPGVDATFANGLIPPMWIRWVDVNTNGEFDAGVDHVYIDTGGPSASVEAGDVRLTEACGCDPNTVVGQCSFCDIGDTFAPIGITPQAVVGFVDLNGNGFYDLNDPLYLDTSQFGVLNGVGIVSGGDIRLTERTVGGNTYPAYSIVQTGDADTYMNPVNLIDPVAAPAVPVTPINTLLGFVDSNCDGLWNTDGTDKLYLQQVVFPLAPPGIVDINQFDRFTTIGDYRLYMPLDEPCWPDCGTKVVECDIDATDAILRPIWDLFGTISGGPVPMSIAVSTSGCVYIDVNNGTGGPRVEVGDVRLTSCCGMEPNTVVDDCDCDYGTPHAAMPPQNTLLGYVDINDNNIYDINDALYLDLDQVGAGSDGHVSPGDLRLTGRTDAGMSYDPYTFVAIGDLDETGSAVGNTLRAPKTNAPLWGPGGGRWQNPSSYLGFRDSNCDGFWDTLDGGDELYLQQMVPEPFGALQEPQFNMFSTIGDFRIYIPPGSPPTCLGDLNNDGTRNFDDVLVIVANWGPCAGCPADLNNDGTVNFDDVLVIVANWGPCP